MRRESDTSARIRSVSYTHLDVYKRQWYNKVDDSGFKSFNVIAATLYEHYDEVLNFFVNRATNALSLIHICNYYYENQLLSDDEQCLMVDTCFFQTFGIPVLKGNPNDLINSNTCLLYTSQE